MAALALPLGVGVVTWLERVTKESQPGASSVPGKGLGKPALSGRQAGDESIELAMS